MSEQTYELNNFGKCMSNVCDFLCKFITLTFCILLCVAGIGFVLFAFSTPFVYIYYITKHNWNVLANGDDNNDSILIKMSKIGFIIGCVIIGLLFSMCLAWILKIFNLNNMCLSFGHAIFYKKIVTKETSHVANPVTNTDMV